MKNLFSLIPSFEESSFKSERVSKRDNSRDKSDLSKDYTNRCGNCHKYMDPEDRYCGNCGTKRGEGAFAPYRNEISCVYGPPFECRYRCSHCGNEWTESSIGGPGYKFCPNCGGTIGESEYEIIHSGWDFDSNNNRDSVKWDDIIHSDRDIDPDNNPDFWNW